MDASQVKQKALELGFHKVGITAIGDSLASDAARLQAWIALGYQADMDWMTNSKRQDVRQVMPGVQSLICVGLNYYTPHARPPGKDYGKISRYGWGRDYHKVLHRKLKALAAWLEARSMGVQTRYYADTGPIQDKGWAQQAGIGWVGKHGNLITPDYGSWIFLGEVLTNMTLDSDPPHTQHCGTCTRCLEACPTQAIVQPFVVDANRCIAYHTIENRAETLPEAVASRMEGWVAGCDICQDVCPWNQRFAKETTIEELKPYPWNIAPKLSELAELSEAERDRRFRASALRRIKLNMLRRNAQANLKAMPSQVGICDKNPSTGGG